MLVRLDWLKKLTTKAELLNKCDLQTICHFFLKIWSVDPHLGCSLHPECHIFKKDQKGQQNTNTFHTIYIAIVISDQLVVICSL